MDKIKTSGDKKKDSPNSADQSALQLPDELKRQGKAREQRPKETSNYMSRHRPDSMLGVQSPKETSNYMSRHRPDSMLGVQSPEEASSDMGTPGSQLPEQPKESRLMEASGTNGLSRAQRTPWPKRPQGGRLMRDSGTNEPSARPSLPLTPPPKRPQGGRLMRDSKNNLPTLEEDSEN